MKMIVKQIALLLGFMSFPLAAENNSAFDSFEKNFDLQHLFLVPAVELNLQKLGHSDNLELVCQDWYNWIRSPYFQNMLIKEKTFVMMLEDYNNNKIFQRKLIALTNNACLTHVTFYIPLDNSQFPNLLQQGLVNKPNLKHLTFLGDLYVQDIFLTDTELTENKTKELQSSPHLQCFSILRKLIISGCLRGSDNQVSYFINTFLSPENVSQLKEFQLDIFNSHPEFTQGFKR